jgi:hypothetical protein
MQKEVNGNLVESTKGGVVPTSPMENSDRLRFQAALTGRPHIPKKDLPAALNDLKQGVGTRFDPAVVQAFFSMIQENPGIIDTRETIASCLDILQQNMVHLAQQNQIEKKLSNPFPGSF